MIRMQAHLHYKTASHSIRWLCISLSSLMVLGSAAFAEDLVPLKPKLPMAKFVGTPKETPPGATAGAIDDKPQAPLMIPKDAVNIAPGKQITTSATNSSPAVLKKIVDGNKEATDDAVVLLRKGKQWIQFDLGAPQELFAIVVWHAHDVPKVYHDVVAQVADDAEFTKNVRTIFNNDTDNSSGLGIGTDREYFETNSGRTFDAKGEKAQYVRLYSKGNTDSSLNEYTEVEIYGRPVK